MSNLQKHECFFSIREASLAELLWIHERIPEFSGKIALNFYADRLEDRMHLPLVAEKDGEILGFKVGSQSDSPDVFYSWMGGVRPEFRKQGIAEALAEHQENWAREKGFRTVFFKTRNSCPAMIGFGLKRGFQIMEVIIKKRVEDFRIIMTKELK